MHNLGYKIILDIQIAGNDGSKTLELPVLSNLNYQQSIWPSVKQGIPLIAIYKFCFSFRLLSVLPPSFQCQAALLHHKKSTNQNSKIAALLFCILQLNALPDTPTACSLPPSPSSHIISFSSTLWLYVAGKIGQKSLVCIICFF